MKLSEAINLGRTLVTPKACSIHTDDGHGCAQGMALAALGSRFYFYGELEDRYPWFAKMPSILGCSCEKCFTLNEPQTARTHLQHLFDWHVMSTKDMTLDQLIDWVRSVEPPEADVPLDIQLAECEPVAVREEAFAYG